MRKSYVKYSVLRRWAEMCTFGWDVRVPRYGRLSHPMFSHLFRTVIWCDKVVDERESAEHIFFLVASFQDEPIRCNVHGIYLMWRGWCSNKPQRVLFFRLKLFLDLILESVLYTVPPMWQTSCKNPDRGHKFYTSQKNWGTQVLNNGLWYIRWLRYMHITASFKNILWTLKHVCWIFAVN